jgi:predicted RNase H-like HicB family nuclease
VKLSIEIEQEEDGRWIAEALELPGVMTYGATREEAISNTEKLAIEVIADRVKHKELPPSALRRLRPSGCWRPWYVSAGI